MFDVDARPPVLSVTATCAIAALALAVAMGVGRFAFTPLLPLMVRDGSLSQSAGAWLAASNYAGYLVGALTASRLCFSLPMLMRVSLVGTAASTAAMGAFDGLAAWIVLRGIAGVLSAWTLIATSAWALQHLARMGRADLSGTVYAGVGLGITFAGLFCLAAARPGVSASEIWLELGAVAALSVAAPSYFAGRPLATFYARASASPTGSTRDPSTGLVVCYGAFGFGYILPATFLPALAREVVDDPQIFGLAWPVFGIAAALSTIATAWRFRHANRLRVWAISHIVMAIGVALPSVFLGPTSIAMAALLVGATFMVVTMVGLQEARARAPGNPTALLGLLTAAFAIGQLAGPLASGTIDLLWIAHRAALGCALQLAASALALMQPTCGLNHIAIQRLRNARILSEQTIMRSDLVAFRAGSVLLFRLTRCDAAERCGGLHQCLKRVMGGRSDSVTSTSAVTSPADLPRRGTPLRLRANFGQHGQCCLAYSSAAYAQPPPSFSNNSTTSSFSLPKGPHAKGCVNA